MTFSNASIRAPVKGKPHICVRDGHWRVSQLTIYHTLSDSALWTEAHLWASDENRKRAAKKLAKNVMLF